MPASASIHFCFHYASFLQSFQINFTAFLNFKAYKKNLVLLTLVNWDLFRNLEDAFALVPGVAVPLPAFSGFLALSVQKHPDPSPASSGSEDGAVPRMSQSCPTLCWVRQSQQGSPEPHIPVSMLNWLIPKKPSRSWCVAVRLR